MSNTITISGNLTRTPELRYTASGVATTTLSVAVNRRVTARSGETTEAVSFFSVVAWQQLAENVCESLAKGARVVVTGRLDQRTWTDSEQERHTTYELVADEVGASLRWATATLHRTSRQAPDPLPAHLSAVAAVDDEVEHVG